MDIETNRLILRGWLDSDAKDLYRLAKDPKVGPIAGWPPHKSEEDSLNIIRTVLSKPYTFAVVLKEENKVVGCIGLMLQADSNLDILEDEGEIGYWIGTPYWGKGLATEATNALIQFAFQTLKLNKLWCGYFDGNNQSKRVQEKCGFIYHHTNKDIHWKLLDEIRTEHITCLEKNNTFNLSKD
jgi:RimJ/RimL family protein N-acetyltransferase